MRPARHGRWWGASALALALAASGCGAGGSDDTVRVAAAASLSEAFVALGDAFSEANDGLTVEISFAGSATIATQVDEGAPLDVVATANTETMDRIVASGRAATTPTVFASNTLVAITPLEDPGDVDALTDLSDVVLAACAPRVPCGALFADLAEAAGLDITADTEEPDVRSVRTKVLLAEVDAGVVYRTDVLDDLRVVEIDPAGTFSTPYPIVALDDAGDPDAAAAFVAFVASPSGQAILADHGFGAP